MTDQKWVNLKTDDGWVIVIPDADIKPHGFPKEGEHSAELAGFDCPCKPKVDWLKKMIIHNSFLHDKIINESITKHFL